MGWKGEEVKCVAVGERSLHATSHYLNVAVIFTLNEEDKINITVIGCISGAE